MIKIGFTSSIGALNYFTSRPDDYLIPAKSEINTISSEWDNESWPIQNIYWECYACNFYLRDDLYQLFQEIQNAADIYIWETGDDAVFDNQKFKLFEINSEAFGREFWKISLRLGLITNKTVENVISNKIDTTISINNGTTDLCTYNIPFTKISDVNFDTTLVDDAKDRIIDFNKISEIIKLRFYLNSTDLLTFISYLKDVGTFTTNYKLKYKNVLYGQYTFAKEKIGQNLYEINLELYASNSINVPNTV